MILDEIIQHKRGEVRLKRAARPLWQVLPLVESARPLRKFQAAFGGSEIAVMAEIKPRSPTKGTFPFALEPEQLARDYQHGGAAALSVLGDEKYFGVDRNSWQGSRLVGNLSCLSNGSVRLPNRS